MVGTKAVILVRKFWRLPNCDRLLLFEAALWLIISGGIVFMLPFRWIGRLASRSVRDPELSEQRCATEVRRVRWGILTCKRWLPWRIMCFEQGLAAHMMLRRRGVLSVHYYGAAQDDRSGLSAHVWARVGDRY